MAKKSEIAVLGLGTMGAALARNLLNNGFAVAGYNRSFQKTQDLDVLPNQKWAPCKSLEELVANLESPRKIILMLPAGNIVDDMIDNLLPLLDKNDVLLDGGNSYFEHTKRRFDLLEKEGIHYLGLGVSGGEQGALEGPSLMPGGSAKAYVHVQPYLEKIAAIEKGQPCCTYVGPDGAGHYVKMVHNGIEYADMQLLAEVYLLLKQCMGLNNEQISTVFQTWNKTDLRSYLVEITAKVLLEQDPQNDGYLIDIIVDMAGQKGTGSWTAIEALRQGQAATLLDNAVQARVISNCTNLREAFKRPFEVRQHIDNAQLLTDVKWVQDAYALCKRVAYAQGFALIHDASARYGWNINLGNIAAIFRNGCIIQAQLLEEIMQIYKQDSALENLLLSVEWQKLSSNLLPSLRKVVLTIVEQEIAAPLINSTLTYMDQLAAPLLGANLIQAQRDYFGAHTFERMDKKGAIHHEWSK